MKFKGIAIAVLGLGLATTACTAAGAGVRGPVDLAPVTVPANPVAIPLREFAASADLTAEQSAGMWSTIKACMAGRGFEFTSPPAVPMTVLDVGRRYAPAHDESTHSHGVDEALGGGVNPAYAVVDDRMKAGWVAAFAGTDSVQIDLAEGYVGRSTGGCLEEGWRASVGDVDAWYELLFRVQDMAVHAYTLAEDDPRVQKALANWSICMGDYGYVVSSPEDLHTVSGASLPAISASCNQEVSLSHTWLTVEAEKQTELLNPASVARLTELVARLDSWNGPGGG